jgi:hypothetical protein
MPTSDYPGTAALFNERWVFVDKFLSGDGERLLYRLLTAGFHDNRIDLALLLWLSIENLETFDKAAFRRLP